VIGRSIVLRLLQEASDLDVHIVSLRSDEDRP
jgi:hypothetical protein